VIEVFDIGQIEKTSERVWMREQRGWCEGKKRRKLLEIAENN
jgi:hypothetical protein